METAAATAPDGSAGSPTEVDVGISPPRNVTTATPTVEARTTSEQPISPLADAAGPSTAALPSASIPSLQPTPPNPSPQPPRSDAPRGPSVAEALAAAAENSEGWLDAVPSVPVYSPTPAQWADPLGFIRTISNEAACYGGCIVKAPVAPTVPAALLLQDLRFTTRQQPLRDAAWGADWSTGVKFYDTNKWRSVAEFARVADEFARRRLGVAAEVPTAMAEAMFWRARKYDADTWIEYGNDVEGTAFHPEDPLGQSKWNLNALPSLPGSALQWCISTHQGINTPMLYAGMLFSFFAWHVEDHFMHSINYAHAGASKVWYCVPAAGADAFEAATADTVYRAPFAAMQAAGTPPAACAAAVVGALMGKTTMLSPEELLRRGVPVFRAVQDPGSYVITFPRAYHGGFSAGFNIGEAVNFTLPDWWPLGEDARRLYRFLRRPPNLPYEQVLCSEALNLAHRMHSTAQALSLPGVDVPAGEEAVTSVFVSTVMRCHAARAMLHARGAAALMACAPGSDAARAVVECQRCFQLCFLCSVAPAAPADGAPHLCLECAVADPGCGHKAVVFVKPCWKPMVELAMQWHPMVRPIGELMALVSMKLLF